MKEQTSAIIVEIRGSYAAALTESGAFARVRNAGYELGQHVLLEQAAQIEQAAQSKRRRARVTAYASMAAGFLMLLLGGFKGYTTPVGMVSLDVNPSIEYTINCFDRVLDVSAVNDDGVAILAGLDEQALRYRPVDEAVDATITTLRESGYLAETTENDVVIAASSYNTRHAEQIAERLNTRVSLQNDLSVYSVAVTGSEVQSAHKLGTSAGKMRIIERLGESLASDEVFNPGDWVKRPVREIIAETKENARQPKTDKEKKPGQLEPSATNDASKPNGNSVPAQGSNSSGNDTQGQQGDPVPSGGTPGGSGTGSGSSSGKP